jgi:hypothetical protein
MQLAVEMVDPSGVERRLMPWATYPLLSSNYAS